MVSSVFFNFHQDPEEQDLLMDLVAESIHVAGQDMWYVPRTIHNRDAVFSEGEFHSYDSAYMLEFMIKSTSQMGGEGALLSKFGVEVRDEMVLTVSKRTFQEEVSTENPDVTRPREGDLIFVPMIGGLFTIKYVDKKAFFYQLGDLQAYDLTLELYENTNADFNTGVPEIDSLYGNDGNNYTSETGGFGSPDEVLQNMTLTTEDGSMILDEHNGWVITLDNFDRIDLSQNVDIEVIADALIDWTEIDPFSERYY